MKNDDWQFWQTWRPFGLFGRSGKPIHWYHIFALCLRAGVNDAKAHELYGTGFVVDNGLYIITALHVVK